jgi:hypothetical protein
LTGFFFVVEVVVVVVVVAEIVSSPVVVGGEPSIAFPFPLIEFVAAGFGLPERFEGGGGG